MFKIDSAHNYNIEFRLQNDNAHIEDHQSIADILNNYFREQTILTENSIYVHEDEETLFVLESFVTSAIEIESILQTLALC